MQTKKQHRKGIKEKQEGRGKKDYFTLRVGIMKVCISEQTQTDSPDGVQLWKNLVNLIQQSASQEQ